MAAFATLFRPLFVRCLRGNDHANPEIIHVQFESRTRGLMLANNDRGNVGIASASEKRGH